LARQDGRSPLDHALNDGEDFELCLVVSASDAGQLLANPPPGVALYRVGEVTAEPGLKLRLGDCDVVALEPRGFDHLATAAPVASGPMLERTGPGLVYESTSEEDTERLGEALAEVVEPGTVIGLVGPLGAGKTRLVRALSEALGVDPGAIASPTFVLIHEYPGRLPIFHFDTYRLAGPEEFDALGPADYWDSGGVCLVEWADRVADRLPSDAWTIRIAPAGETARRFELAFPEGSDVPGRLVDRLRADRPSRV
jgi:tRNA threonylcarbamoyladenosine biosynthesis protein TsaE